ncbi:MAG: hypothetical protein ABIB55_01615, partial [Candidatus Nealsonbacteria bacterium]
MIKIAKISLFIFGVVLILGIGFYLWRNYGWRMGIDFSCINIEEHNISGVSMDPLLKDGQKVKGLAGYYDC